MEIATIVNWLDVKSAATKQSAQPAIRPSGTSLTEMEVVDSAMLIKMKSLAMATVVSVLRAPSVPMTPAMTAPKGVVIAES